MRQKKVLLTAFEPYGKVRVNSSWEAIRQWEGRELGSHKVHVACLPVVYGAVRPRLEALIQKIRPAAVLAFGQYPYRRREILLENIALNIDAAEIADNRGRIASGRPVRRRGPLALATRLPLKRFQSRLKQLGIPVRMSYFAGTYLCNHLFYHLMDIAARRRGLRAAGFVHLPPLSRVMTKSRLRRAIREMTRLALS